MKKIIGLAFALLCAAATAQTTVTNYATNITTTLTSSGSKSVTNVVPVSVTTIAAPVTVPLTVASAPANNNAPPVLVAVAVPTNTLVQTYATNSAGQVVATSPSPETQTFWTTAIGYISSFNTNLPTFWASSSNYYQAWIGAGYQSGLNLGVQLGIEAQPFSAVRGLTLGSVTTLAAQVGTYTRSRTAT